jgi:hypothetical protein
VYSEADFKAEMVQFRHCERSEAIQKIASEELDCFVASLLAMTVQQSISL